MRLNIKIGITTKESRKLLRQELALIKSGLQLGRFNAYNVPVSTVVITSKEEIPGEVHEWELVEDAAIGWVVRYTLLADVAPVMNALKYVCKVS